MHICLYLRTFIGIYIHIYKHTHIYMNICLGGIGNIGNRKNNLTYKYAAVIIEPRLDPTFEFCVRNVMHHLNTDWELIVIHSSGHYFTFCSAPRRKIKRILCTYLKKQYSNPILTIYLIQSLFFPFLLFLIHFFIYSGHLSSLSLIVFVFFILVCKFIYMCVYGC
jgi:hypothetical protein